MNDRTIGKKIGLGYSTLLLILVLAGGYAILRMQAASNMLDEFSPDLPVASTADASMGNVLPSEQTYGLMGTKESLERARKSFSELKIRVAELKDSTQAAGLMLSLAGSEKALSDAEAANTRLTKSASLLLGGVLAALMVGTGFALVSPLNLSRPVQKAVGLMERVATGDLAFHLRTVVAEVAAASHELRAPARVSATDFITCQARTRSRRG